MNTLDKLLPKNLYHSYVVEGDPHITSENLVSVLKGRGFIKDDNSNLFLGQYNSFKIADSYEIKAWHNELPNEEEDKKVCIISASFINHDAERTLLKIIEEPKKNNYFFIIVPNSSVLLDTIISRVQVIFSSYNDNNIWGDKINEFLNSTPKARIEFIEKIIKKHKDDDDKSILRAISISFINKIEKKLFEKFKNDKNDEKNNLALREIQEKREYLNLPGSSVKMILEHLALMI